MLALLLVGLATLPARAATDRLDTPLTAQPAEPLAGRRVVLDRALSACLLCHTGPFPAPHLHGSIGPDLTDVGARLDPGQLRLRLVSSARLNPETVMPSYYATQGLNRVGTPWREQTILTAQQIEDVVAYLSGLRPR